MKLAFGLGNQTPLEKEVELTKRAAQEGLYGISIPEHLCLSTNDVFAKICFLSSRVNELAFIANSVNQYSRHPISIAMAANMAAEATDGKFILGLGTGAGDSLRKMRIDDARTLSRLKEAILITRALCEGRDLSFEGKFFSIESTKLQFAAKYKIPIYVPAIRNNAISLAAECGDGIFMSNCLSANQVKHVANQVSHRAKNADFGIAASLTYIPTSDHAEGLRSAKIVISRYVSIPGIGETLLEGAGADPSSAPKIRAGKEAISDEIAEKLCVVGESRELETRMDEFREAGVKVLTVSTPANPERVISELGKLRGSF